MNSIAEIKSSLHLYIAETDDVNILSKIKEYAKGLIDHEDKIIAFSSSGKTLTQDQYKNDIDQIIAYSNEGDVISQEEMERDL